MIDKNLKLFAQQLLNEVEVVTASYEKWCEQNSYNTVKQALDRLKEHKNNNKKPKGKPGRPQVLKQEAIEECIRLCMRDEGATSDEIGTLLGLPAVDAPWRLKWFIKHKYPHLEIRSFQMTPGQKFKFGYESSNARVFKIKPVAAGE